MTQTLTELAQAWVSKRSMGCGEYVEFDGTVECSNCGKKMNEEEASYESNYCFCSYTCYGQFVGVA
jgi:hypothetical protein